MVDAGLPTQAETPHPVAVRHRKVYRTIGDAEKRFVLSPPGGWPDPDVMDHIARHSLRMTEDGWVWKFDSDGATSLNEETGIRDALLSIQTPCAFVFGELSEFATAACMGEVHAIAPKPGP